MPPSWRDEYKSAIEKVERDNPVNMDLISMCSQMADRITALEAEKATLESQLPTASSLKSTKNSDTPDDPGVTQLRLEMAEALRSRGVSETRLRTATEELEKLRVKTKSDSRSIRQLDAERANLTTRLKDREYELREKRKLLENVQDEHITLELQLAMTEKERDKVKKDNIDLVDRWMQRKAKDAEAMNEANGP